MASTRTTFTLDDGLAALARRLDINVSAAAREGVAVAVRAAMAESDREAYQQSPESVEPFWQDIEAWGNE